MKSFIIRLKGHSESEKISNECVEQAKKFNLKVEFFDGIYGNDAEEIFRTEKILKYPKSLKKDTPGVKGCAASHYLLWKKCMEENESFLILEQDGYMVRPLPPDIDNLFVDICKLDSSDPFSENYEDKFNINCSEVKVVDYDLNWGYKKKAAPYGRYFRGAWAYIIKPGAAKKLVDSFKSNGWVPADKQIGENILDLKTTNCTIFRIHPLYNHLNITEKSLTRHLK